MFLSGVSRLGGWSAHAHCAQIPLSVRLEKRRGDEREGGERGREQLEKEKERQDGHKRCLSLRQGPFLGVGRVDLPPPTCRCSAMLDTRRTGMSGNGGNLQKS